MTNQDVESTIDIQGFSPVGKGIVYTLDGPSLNATNEENPDTVKIQESVLTGPLSKFTYTLKKRSLTVFEFKK